MWVEHAPWTQGRNNELSIEESKQACISFCVPFTLGFNHPAITKCPPFPRTHSGGAGKAFRVDGVLLFHGAISSIQEAAWAHLLVGKSCLNDKRGAMIPDKHGGKSMNGSKEKHRH